MYLLQEIIDAARIEAAIILDKSFIARYSLVLLQRDK